MREGIARLVGTAIKAIGDIAEPIIYNSHSSGAYDPATGGASYDTIPHSLNAVIAPLSAITYNNLFSNERKEGETPDLSCLFASIDLPITPDSSDTITRKGREYKIIRISHDPAGGSYTLYIKRTG